MSEQKTEHKSFAHPEERRDFPHGHADIIDVSHHRLFSSPSVQDAQLEVMIEARDAAHGAAIEASLAEVFVLRRL